MPRRKGNVLSIIILLDTSALPGNSGRKVSIAVAGGAAVRLLSRPICRSTAYTFSRLADDVGHAADLSRRPAPMRHGAGPAGAAAAARAAAVGPVRLPEGSATEMEMGILYMAAK
jgi:hypothetical protein